jgi:hypothetical protein
MADEIANITTEARRVQRQLKAEYDRDDQDQVKIKKLETRLEEIDEEFRSAGGYEIS